MSKFEFEGKTYNFINGQWYDEKYICLCDDLQRKMNAAFPDRLVSGEISTDEDLSEYTVQELIQMADAAMEWELYEKAMNYYMELVRKASLSSLIFVLPKISACFRRLNRPLMAISLFDYVHDRYGDAYVSAGLFTSAAAAYCDLGEFATARAYCDKAEDKMHGIYDEKIENARKRIDYSERRYLDSLIGRNLN